MMQWRVTDSFKFLPSLCPWHTWTLYHLLLTSNILNQTLCSVPLLSFWLRSGAGSTRVPFDISNFWWLSPTPPPPHPHLVRWPRAVWQCLVGSPWLAAKVFVCGGCLLLMLFDILAGILSVWLPRCCSCSDILKGSLVWAAVNVSSFLSLLLSISISLSRPFNHSDRNKGVRNLILKMIVILQLTIKYVYN